MNNRYLIFFKKAVIVFVLLGVVDVLAGKLLAHFYCKVSSGESAQTTYAVTQANEDCIILGTSRAVHHYIPTVIQDSMNITCYNAGKDGQGILYQYAILKTILARKTPQVIILDVDANEFNKDEISYGRLSALLPYYYKFKEIQPVVCERSKYEKIKTISSLYRYNSLLLTAFSGITGGEGNNDLKGYVPLDKLWGKQLAEPIKEKETGIDTVKINYFRLLLKEADRANIKVIAMASPVFEKTVKEPRSLIIASEICREMKVPVINLRQEPTFINRPEYFADIEHLNRKGAIAYMNFICPIIKRFF